MLGKLIFYLSFPIIFLISLLPFTVLYILSDVLFIFIYYIFEYRKKVVLQNLFHSFPEKSSNEIHQISIKYYHHLCDLLVESIKLCTISRQNLLKRCSIEGNKAILDNYFEKNISCIAVLGHVGNWEWASPVFSNYQHQQLYIIYKKISNTQVDTWVNKVRTRFGAKLIESQNAVRSLFINIKNAKLTILVADQSPNPNNALWLQFLNQDTAVFRGMAVLSQKFNSPIFYLSVRKPKRGYYDFSYTLMVDEPQNYSELEIMKIFMLNLENDIKKQPEIWLWSHKRWKHKRQ